MRREFILGSLLLLTFVVIVAFFSPPALWALVVVGPVISLGTVDVVQKKHTIRRNFPVFGRFRYLLEALRPEINQYFVESNADGVPFSREQRSIVYQRAKGDLDTLPFGTQKNVYDIGYEWAPHSLAPEHVDPQSLRVTFGETTCRKPYSASVLNISAMSFGSLSANAIRALNGGAKLGNFAHNTGEGGLSRYHLEPGGDIIWQIGTAYFGCRTPDGRFDEGRFTEKAQREQVRMIEVKLSQGAKPSHGGILPKAKLTREIADIRGVPMGEDVLSPPVHSAFSTPIGLLEFVTKLRELSGGKPVGFKLCIGRRNEFIAIAKAMHETGLHPDFITIDGGEGGTGAAPLEFSNSLGYPFRDGLVFAHNVLVGFGLRRKLRLIASGKTVTGFDLLVKFALGADTCNAARSMMLALGCIQALRCNSNRCPTGVATQDPSLMAGLDVADKRVRVANYHRETIKSTAELLGAIGAARPSDVHPWHIKRRVSVSEAKHFGELYPFLEEGALLREPIHPEYERAFRAARADTFKADHPH